MTLALPNARRAAGTTLAVAAACLTAPPSVRAQGAPGPDAATEARVLAERVARAGDGAVRFAYATRPGVCGDGGRGITWVRGDDTSHIGSWDFRDGSGDRWAWRCEPGPARVTLRVEGGVPRRLRLTVGGPGAPGGAGPVTDLGPVSAPAAAAYLLDLAAPPDAPAAEQAVLAAVVADAGAVWPRLLRLARADGASGAARHAGTFWASQFACEAARAVRARRGPLAHADTADRAMRREVVFALSQRRGEERAAPLARAARADRDPAVRCAALFWLGEGPSARGGGNAATLAVFEEVLRGP